MRTTFLLALVALVSVAACSSETGVLVSTTTQDGFDSEIYSLRFYVGEDVVAPNSRGGQYFADDAPLDDVEVGDMDLASNPYKLLIHPRDSGDAEARIAVGVFALDRSGQTIGFGYVPDPIGFVQGRITQWEVEIHDINGPDFFQGPNGCFKWLLGNDEWMHIGRTGDTDCDGVTVDDGDCNDLNPDQQPGIPENCDNGIDDDCNGFADSEDRIDHDGDTFTACPAEGPADCDDRNAEVNPEQDEICNGRDDNCNDMCDEFDSANGETDPDGDGVTFCGSVLSNNGQRCVAYDPQQPDCDNRDSTRFPGNTEQADGVDNNCSLVCDDDPSLDSDMDGFTEWGHFGVCGQTSADCDNEDAYRYPGAPEFCDGVDSDCDGGEIKDTPCFVKQNGIICQEGVRECVMGAVTGECNSLRSADIALPNGLCIAYQGCQSMGVSDPYKCVIESLQQETTMTEMCTVRSNSSLNGCEGGSVEIGLPGGTGTNCSFHLIGANKQQGYHVGLGGLDGAVVNACEVLLKVEATPQAGDATIYVLFDDSAGPAKVIQVKLTREIVANCQAQPALSCSTWL